MVSAEGIQGERCEQVARANSLDRATLLSQESGCSGERKDCIPIVVSYYPALSELKGIVSRLQNMSEVSEEHKSVFRQQPLVVFRHASNLMYSLVRAKLPKLQIKSDKGCFRCGKSRCQICRLMSTGNSFRSNVSGSEFKISSRYTCDSSGVVYLLGCKVCGKQYVGSTFTSFRVRFNNCKSASRRYSKGEVVTKADFFRHFTEANHHGFMEDVSF